ncbi:MAG: PQQ-like beta-propeller repeat protein [Gemmataceae bacterium]|nr:PQQ-like beta-propeller repeat protein [Gemmataceae bacterium]
MLSRLTAHALAMALLFALTGAAVGADWPQFRGPKRDGVSAETGLLKEWPKDGPKQVWKAKNLGLGFGTPSVADGKIFGLGTRDGKDGVWAIKEADGSELWFTPFDDPRKTNQNNGPSGTPTVVDGKAYALSSKGKLVCLDAGTGKAEWQVDFVKDFGGSVPGWGYTESPLIDGDKLICTPGGKNTLVALEKGTGKVVWKAAVPKADGAHYSSPIAIESEGRRQYVQFVSGGVVSVGASDGAFLWRYNAPANGTANCSTPIFDAGHVFAASAYGTGGGLAKLGKSGDKLTATEVYFEKRLENHHGGMVLVNGFLYGEGKGKLTCTNFLTGEIAWSEPKASKGSITCADGLLYHRNEGDGQVILIEADPKKYAEKGRLRQPDRSRQSAWAHPVVANGKLYLRDQELLLCYDVQAK